MVNIFVKLNQFKMKVDNLIKSGLFYFKTIVVVYKDRFMLLDSSYTLSLSSASMLFKLVGCCLRDSVITPPTTRRQYGFLSAVLWLVVLVFLLFTSCE